MLDNFILKIKEKEKQVSILNVRYAKPSEEANKNLLYTILIFLITIGSILGHMFNEKALMALTFFLFLFV